MSDEKVQVAPVDTYPERPLSEAKLSVEDQIKAEGRVGQQDQIPDYRKNNPTLAPSAAHDPEVARELIAKSVAKRVTKKEAFEQAEIEGLV